ncbi:MAG: glycoside hydrolase family 99-like domain-containing protein [Cyanobacteria bacterium SZAS TMP-1]|nr:glycoside hydrolase family 99-like domain-containing protein [Cyanobacteria bacterium SZAS TMP-1]
MISRSNALRLIGSIFALGSVISGCFAGAARAAEGEQVPPVKPVILAHYLPWFESRPTSKAFGWHWTMNHFDPSKMSKGRRQAASHYDPLMGLYDSSDPYALECQVLLMKIAGIDGVMLDWYGRDNYFDYVALDRNTQKMIDAAQKVGLQFAVMYEDRVVSKMISGGVLKEADAVSHGHDMLLWMEQNWFKRPAYVKVDGRPLLAVFGPLYYQGDSWQKMFQGLTPPPLLFTEYEPKAGANGAFYWPSPRGGGKQSKQKLDAYYEKSKEWRFSIPCAYPRFDDIYEQAGVHPSYGSIKDRGGKTFRQTLERALKSGQPVVQIATWNDWGEGTQIEPSVEFGYRDLEVTQDLRRKLIDKNFKYTAEDLRLPVQLYFLRRRMGVTPAEQANLDKAAKLLAEGKTAEASQLLDK